MRRERRRRWTEDLTGPLWDDRPQDVREMTALEALVRASKENPDDFCEEWVAPLLAEGLNLDGVFDLLLDGAARPN